MAHIRGAIALERVIQARIASIGGNSSVRRVLPYHQRRSVGPFVLLDHGGPAYVNDETAMDVAPHPHCGLATLTYMISGAGLHRDSTGAEQLILPREVNFMVAGRGVTHSERWPGIDAVPAESIDERGRALVHMLQLWVALPKELERGPASFHHTSAADVPTLPGAGAGVEARLAIGSAMGVTAPIPGPSPMMLVDLSMEAGRHAELQLPPGHEAGVYCVSGGALSGPEGTVLSPGELAVYTSAGEAADEEGGAGTVRIQAARDGDESTRVVVIGGEPLPEPRYLLWNFVASDKEMLERAAEDWRALDRDRFGEVVGEDNLDSIPLPPGGRKEQKGGWTDDAARRLGLK